MNNKTLASEVILLGFSNELKTNICLFFIFLLIYSFSLVGNCLIICLIIVNTSLHTPMYFFLVNLSFIDLCYSSSAIPKLLTGLLSTHRTISVTVCLIQLKMLLLIAGSECQLLAVMAYDRYIAICHPLHYYVLMRWRVCCYLAGYVWIFSFINIIIPSFAMPIIVCYPNKINHFMCEVLSVLRLSCDDTSLQQRVIYIVGFFAIVLPFLLITVSYICIISTVLMIRAAERSKAFSTCSSHMTVVIMYFGTAMVTYLTPPSVESLNQDKYVSVFYVIVSPMLNPLIYSLNNREVKNALTKLYITTIQIKMADDVKISQP